MGETSWPTFVKPALLGLAGAVCGGLVAYYYFAARDSTPNRPAIIQGVAGLIGNTPLVRIESLSEATGCNILAKAELMNPGGSSKDRIALQIIRDAQHGGTLRPGGILVEGTSGSTGISLALLARSLGYRAHIVMPDDQASEKVQLLQQFGATVQLVKPVSIANSEHYVNVARRVAHEINKASSKPAGDKGEAAQEALFCNQFETDSNFRAHYEHTGPEIWSQTGGIVDGFVSGAGTGGTIAGVAAYLKEHNPDVKVFLIDPTGSSLYAKITHGVAFAPQQAERIQRRHRYDTIIEGVGIDRVTANFSRGMDVIDGAFRGTDKEAVEMSRYLLRNDGIFVGSSTSLNLVGAVKLARQLGPGHTIVTILCDSGMRHLSRFWNPQYLAAQGLDPSCDGTDLHFIA